MRTAKCSSRVKSLPRRLSLSYIRGKLHLSPVSFDFSPKKKSFRARKRTKGVTATCSGALQSKAIEATRAYRCASHDESSALRAWRGCSAAGGITDERAFDIPIDQPCFGPRKRGWRGGPFKGERSLRHLASGSMGNIVVREKRHPSNLVPAARSAPDYVPSRFVCVACSHEPRNKSVPSLSFFFFGSFSKMGKQSPTVHVLDERPPACAASPFSQASGCFSFRPQAPVCHFLAVNCCMYTRGHSVCRTHLLVAAPVVPASNSFPAVLCFPNRQRKRDEMMKCSPYKKTVVYTCLSLSRSLSRLSPPSLVRYAGSVGFPLSDYLQASWTPAPFIAIFSLF